MLALELTCIAQPISTDAPSLLLFVLTRTSDCIPLVPFVHRGRFLRQEALVLIICITPVLYITV